MSHLVNFCLGPFIKCAETSSVCADGCSVGNLVSMDSSARRRGFQVEHFIRPPVHVEFQFTVPVHVGCILLDPLLSPGTEAKIEVSGSLGGKCHYFKHFGTAVVKDHSLLVLRNKEFERHFGEFPPGMAVLGSHVSLVDRGLTFQSLKHSNALTMLQCLRVSFTRFTGVKPVALKSMELWGHSSPACSAKDRQTLESIFIGLQEHPPFASPFNCLGVYKSSQEQPLASHRSNESQHEIPSACDSLQPAGVIPAGSTEDGLPSAGLEQSMTVCLGMEEIKHMQGLGMEPLGVQRQLEGRGNPPTVSHGLCHRVPEGETDTLEATSSSCSVDLQETLLKNKTPSTTGQVWLPSRQQSHAHSNSSIPESFLDEITYEVMVIPMLLPSGHYVDRTTLERVRDTDAAYGRGECDPFTALVLNPLDDILATLVEDALCTEEMSQGVPFTEINKPQFCAQLKSQIDQFLLTREDLGVAGGKSVGSATDITRHLIHTQGVKRRWAGDQCVVKDVVKRFRHFQDAGEQSRDHSAALDNTIQGHHKATTSIGCGRKLDHDVEVADSLNKALHDLYSAGQQ